VDIELEGVVPFALNLPDARCSPPGAADRHGDFLARVSALTAGESRARPTGCSWSGAITPWGYERLDQPDNYEGSTRGIADVRVVTAKAASVDPANALRGDSG
jgi:hypothetical protein